MACQEILVLNGVCEMDLPLCVKGQPLCLRQALLMVCVAGLIALQMFLSINCHSKRPKKVLFDF